MVNFKKLLIADNSSILDAMKVMEDRSSQISVLPIVDGNSNCLGLLTLHDLYQTKLI